MIIALVLGLTLNSSAQYFKTAVNGAFSGTLITRYGNFGSDERNLELNFSNVLSHFLFDVDIRIDKGFVLLFNLSAATKALILLFYA